MPISREYQQYLETELTKRKSTIFELVCNKLESLFTEYVKSAGDSTCNVLASLAGFLCPGSR